MDLDLHQREKSMFMDLGLELSGLIEEFRFADHHLPHQNFPNSCKLQSQEPYSSYNIDVASPNTFYSSDISNSDTFIVNPAPTSYTVPSNGSSVFSEIESDITLKYISKMLLEEDIDDKLYVPHGDPALLAAEKPFLEILDENCLSSLGPPSGSYVNGLGSPDSNSNDASIITSVLENHWIIDHVASQSTLDFSSTLIDHPSPSSFISRSSINNVFDGYIEETHLNTTRFPDFLFKNLPVLQFNKGVQEASKFLPDNNKLIIDFRNTAPLYCQRCSKETHKLVEEKRESTAIRQRGRKNSYHDDILDTEDERCIKQVSVYLSTDEIIRSKLFDNFLLCPHGDLNKNAISELREFLKCEASKNGNNDTAKMSSNGKSRRKKHINKDVVDLRTLLIHCAQTVAADDCHSANELLKKIRQHSSPYGDGSQRLANIFLDGLEARLAGTGSHIYRSLKAKPHSATDTLKAFQLYLAACPFKKISHFVANRTILNVAEKSITLHIIHFGIYFGFQWPCLMQRLSLLPGGPPKLRITGIDVPQPGFRPNERIEETGRRLADYAQSFNVPFEFHPIASKWENINIEDLKINKDEMLVVNCLYKFRNIVDETVVVDYPRNIVLNNIRKMNPNIFIHGVVNGAYDAPFFATRFKEALFHYSTLFDMLETIVPREHPDRLLIEREMFGREALNVIACEGSERVERPETYKQWHARNLRAGFKQLPLIPNVLQNARANVESCYHKDFVVDSDSGWLLQGWKGRIIYALSTWKPAGSGI